MSRGHKGTRERGGALGVSVNGLVSGQYNDRCWTVDFDIQDVTVNNC